MQNTWSRLKPSSRPQHDYHPLAETRFIFSLSDDSYRGFVMLGAALLNMRVGWLTVLAG